MFRLVRRMPFFRLLAIAQLALLARRHLQQLTPVERRRLGELVRRGRNLSPAEKDELRALVARLEPRAFAGAAANALSPFPRRFRRW
jgi:hypothetical protein